MRGGKRKGAGAPAGPRLQPEDKAKRFNTTMAPDLQRFLDLMKKNGTSKSKVIDKALRNYMHEYLSPVGTKELQRK